MKTIRKNSEPRELLNWRIKNQNVPENLCYRSIPPEVLEAVRQALLCEQFYLCAYTMMPLKTASECADSPFLTRDSCHIEHIFPQSCTVAGEDIDYQNMLACHPPSQSAKGISACDYGAQAKADYDPQVKPFVSPLGDHTASQFVFNQAGKVRGQTDAARATVKVLNLNTPSLVSNRMATIRGRLYPKGDKGKPISAAAARRLAKIILQPDARGCLPAYCVAVQQVALVFASQREKKAQRMEGRSER